MEFIFLSNFYLLARQPLLDKPLYFFFFFQFLFFIFSFSYQAMRNEIPKMHQSPGNSKIPDDYLIPDSSHLYQDQNSHSLLPRSNQNRLTIAVLPRYVTSLNSWSPSKNICIEATSSCVSTQKKDDEEEAYDSGCGGDGNSSVSTSPALLTSPLKEGELEFSFDLPRLLPIPDGTNTSSSNQYLPMSRPMRK